MNSIKEGPYDNLFLDVLGKEGQPRLFIDAVFNFLYRRTDFFRVQKTVDDIGFPKGFAKYVVNLYVEMYEDRMDKMEALVENLPSLKDRLLPPKNSLVCVGTKSVDVGSTSQTVERSSVDFDPTKDVGSTSQTVGRSAVDFDPTKNAGSTSQTVERSTVDFTQDSFRKHRKSYNGETQLSYSWTQSIADIELSIPVPKPVRNKVHVKVLRNSTSLAVKWLEEPESQWKILVSGKLPFPVRVCDSTSTFTPPETLNIVLEKVEERWWDDLFEDEPKIDVKRIEKVEACEDLDKDEQETPRNRAYQNMLRMQGKASTEESKVSEVLKNLWFRLARTR